ncbi:hypothetical protein GS429_17090 [Natronorubrum sp. JWXQ-INN-674]|uniref:Uncharacterized protein n=1 Tax=Natronorubrum halalkaliphilum TaxID=2691917 RepID=A0A6B0VQK2_9EURY|nr:DUF5797 family protein [Natronorubrum halalkaliphilum]MXV63744.1 hypothetical protein [Natronorubrum halalkaliphilum]
MTLSEEATERLADVVELQPTKNSELQDRWSMESGSEVHQYLENELGDYYYRDDNSLIRATAEAADLVDVEPGIESHPDDDGVPSRIRVPELQSQIVAVLAGPKEESESVVSVLHKLRDEFDVDPESEAVRSGLQSLRRKGVVEVEYRTVPTFRLTVEREDLEVDISD